MLTPFPRLSEARKATRVKDKGAKSKEFDGVYGHMMEDSQKKAAGKPQVPKSPRGPDPKPTGKGKGGKGSRLVRKPMRGGGSLRRCCQPTREVQSTRLASLGKDPGTGTILSKWKS